jgi:hypothetical protein
MFGFHELFTPDGLAFLIFEFDKDKYDVWDVGDGSFDIKVKKVLFCNNKICPKTVNLSQGELSELTHNDLHKLSHIIIDRIFLTTSVYQRLRSHK